MGGLIAAAEPDPQAGVILQDRFINRQFDRVYSGLYYQIRPVQPGPGGQISRSLVRSDLDHHAGRHAWRNCLWLCQGSGKSASARPVAAGGISSRRYAAAQRHPRLRHHRGWRPVGGGSGDQSLQRHLDLVFPSSGPGPDDRGVPASARSACCRFAACRNALARIRNGSAQTTGRKFPRRDRAARRRTQFPDRAQQRSGRASPHPCLQPGAFPQDAAQRACERSRRLSPVRCRIRCADRWIRCAVRSIIIWRGRVRPAAVNVLGNRTQVAPVLNDLARVLARIHAERAIVIDCRLSARSFLPRRASGSGRDGGQSDGQCLQMGSAPGAGARDRRPARFSRCWWRMTARA